MSSVGEQRYPDIEGLKVLELIGEGAFGEVYHCQELDGDQSLYAVKVIRSGLATKQIISRFESESKALQRCNHPNIAAVYKVGLTSVEQPFFMMEYCSGVPLSEWIRNENPDLESRVYVFSQVVAGVEHAHSKGIIHRDLKPKNIMVDDSGDKPVVKVIDFGLAKALDNPLRDVSTITARKAGIGTWDYMSPEQAAGLDGCYSVSSDIYSLGCLLFFCLTGVPPHNGLAHLPEFERLKKLNEDFAPHPSKVNSHSGLRGDGYYQERIPKGLEWITLKALSIDPHQRYTSASEFLLDLEAETTQSNPLLARSPNRFYKLRFYARLHMWTILMFSGVISVLVISLILVLQERNRAWESELKAQAGLQESDQRAKQLERMLEVHADTLSDFHIPEMAEALKSEFAKRSSERAVEPLIDHLEPERIVEFRKEFEEQIDFHAITRDVIEMAFFDDLEEALAEFSDDPILSARWGRIYAQSLMRSGNPRVAYALQKKNQSTFDAIGPFKEEAWKSRFELVMICSKSGRYLEAMSELEKLVTNLESLEKLSLIDQFDFYAKAGWLLQKLGEYGVAYENYQAALDFYRANNLEDPDREVTLLSNIGTWYNTKRKFEEAKDYFEVAEKLVRESGAEVLPKTLVSLLNNMATLELNMGRYEEATVSLLKTLEISRSSLGAGHGKTLIVLSNLAVCFQYQGDLEKSLKLYLEVFEKQQRVFGRGSYEYFVTLNNLGSNYKKLSRYDQGRAMYLEGLGEIENYLGPNHPLEFVLLLNLAVLEMKAKSHQAALEAFLNAREFGMRSRGKEDSDILFADSNIGYLYSVLGEADAALHELKSTVPVHIRVLGVDHSDTRLVLNDFLEVLGSFSDQVRFDSEIAALLSSLDNSVSSVGFVPALIAHKKSELALGRRDYTGAKSHLDAATEALKGQEDQYQKLFKGIGRLRKEIQSEAQKP